VSGPNYTLVRSILAVEIYFFFAKKETAARFCDASSSARPCFFMVHRAEERHMREQRAARKRKDGQTP